MLFQQSGMSSKLLKSAFDVFLDFCVIVYFRHRDLLDYFLNVFFKDFGEQFLPYPFCLYPPYFVYAVSERLLFLGAPPAKSAAEVTN
jgi:hypothetical protein